MILTPHFTYGHIGRTGGDTIFNWIATHYPHWMSAYDLQESPEKHVPFHRRPHWCWDRILVCGLRRLPQWFVSQRVAHGLPLEPLDNDGDMELTRMTCAGRYPVSVWLRSEYLLDDFLVLASRWDKKAHKKRAAIAATPTKKPTLNPPTLTPEQIETLYVLNPQWTALEKAQYAHASA